MRTEKTERGFFKKDRSGMYHYNHTELGHVSLAIKDALRYRPKGVTWFWFNGTPAAIYSRDTIKSLQERWTEWRRAYQKNSETFLDVLSGLNT